jgi:hypothetical protein
VIFSYFGPLNATIFHPLPPKLPRYFGVKNRLFAKMHNPHKLIPTQKSGPSQKVCLKADILLAGFGTAPAMK